jgi:hypothetical protein
MNARGMRKVLVFAAAAASLLVGLVICRSCPNAVGLYGIFAPSLATATGIFTYGNAREHSASKPPERAP